MERREEHGDLMRIRRQLRKMAFGRANDCVKLVMREDVDIGKLDLSLLKEIKRSDKGVEIKLLDRMQILAELARITLDETDAAAEILAAIGGDESE